MSSFTINKQSNTPDTPASGKVTFWPGTDGIWRSVDDTGVVTIYTPLTQEQVQDIVGAMLTDSSSVNVTYDDAGNFATIEVIAGGVNHNALLNYVANEHINHSSVSILPGTGMSGGGDITTSRTLSIANTTVTSGTYGSASQVAAFTVNAQGQLTSASLVTITPAAIGAQASSTELTGLASLSGTGIVVRTGAGTYTNRQISVTSGHLTVSNGNGVSGNPNLGLPNVGTPGSYGSATLIPTITTDAQGRVSGVTTQTVTPPCYEAQATSDQTRTSNAFALLDSMAVTPVAGTYLVDFDCDADTVANDIGGEIELRLNGVSIAGTLRQMLVDVTATLGGTGKVRGSLRTKKLVTVNGTDVVQVYYRSLTNGQSFIIRNRNITLLRVAQQ